jgi:hypothetical protein
VLVILWQKEIVEKAARKMLVKLTLDRERNVCCRLASGALKTLRRTYG